MRQKCALNRLSKPSLRPLVGYASGRWAACGDRRPRASSCPSGAMRIISDFGSVFCVPAAGAHVQAVAVDVHRYDRGDLRAAPGATGDDRHERPVLAAGLPNGVARRGVAATEVQVAVERHHFEDVEVRRAHLDQPGMLRPRLRDLEQRSVACQVRRRGNEQVVLPNDHRAKAHRPHLAAWIVDGHGGQLQRFPVHAVVAAQDPRRVGAQQRRQVLVGADAGGV